MFTETGELDGAERMRVNERGFSLRGADQSGNCYFVKHLEKSDLNSNDVKFANILAEDVNE